MYIHVISVMAQFIYSRPTANNVTVAAIVYETCAYIYIYIHHIRSPVTASSAPLSQGS